MREHIHIRQKNFEGVYDVEWNDAAPAPDIAPVKQVAGILFNDKGQVLLIRVVDNWQLPGGCPEKNESFEQTLRREADEEGDVEITDIAPLGFQKIVECMPSGAPGKKEPFYQLRYVARIAKVKPQTIDPAHNKIPERIFIPPGEFTKYCPWGKIANKVVQCAVEWFHSKK